MMEAELRKSIEDLCGEDYDFKSNLKYEDEFEFAGRKFKKLDGYGGEGFGDAYWRVFQVSDGEHTKIFKWDGSYTSYDGSCLDCDDFTEVFAVTKTIITYE
jgi:hypothetical protein